MPVILHDDALKVLSELQQEWAQSMHAIKMAHGDSDPAAKVFAHCNTTLYQWLGSLGLYGPDFANQYVPDEENILEAPKRRAFNRVTETL